MQMSKNFFVLLLFFTHFAHAIPVNQEDSVLFDAQENQSDLTEADLTESDATDPDLCEPESDASEFNLTELDPTESDTYLPVVENYPILAFELLGMDYLYNQDSNSSSAFHTMKKFDWSGLFRYNGAVLYAIRMNKSRFAFCPGVGWSTLYYAFAGKKDGDEIVYPTLVKKSSSLTECEEPDKPDGMQLSYSAIKIPFFDLLFRLRFNSVLDEPKEGFHGWLGIKLGFRLNASTTIEYDHYNDKAASLVRKADFNLKSYAWALQAGVGYHRFGLTGAYYLTSLFQDKQGPAHSDSLKPFSIGIYVDLL